MKGGLIYKVTNKITGMSYIGLTTRTLKVRKAEHLEAATFNSPLQFHRAIREWGKNNFEWKIITRRKTLKGLINAEIRYIEKYGSFRDGYNSSTGGEVD